MGQRAEGSGLRAQSAERRAQVEEQSDEPNKVSSAKPNPDRSVGSARPRCKTMGAKTRQYDSARLRQSGGCMVGRAKTVTTMQAESANWRRRLGLLTLLTVLCVRVFFVVIRKRRFFS